MRHSNDASILFLAACFFGATSCSDDGDRSAESNPLQPLSGEAASGGAAGAGGAAAEAAGGSANAGAPAGASAAGSAGDGGSGAAPEGDPGLPDAGAEPPGEESPPGEPAAVGFSNVFTILQVNCGACHAMPGSFVPAFAQDDVDASYEVTQEPSNFADQLYYERIVVRAVDERTMPPGCFGGDLGTAGCLSEEDAALLEAWADQGGSP